MLALILSIYLRDSLFQKSIVFIVITFFLILKLTHVLVLVFLVHHLVEGIIFLLLRLLNLIWLLLLSIQNIDIRVSTDFVIVGLSVPHLLHLFYDQLVKFVFLVFPSDFWLVFTEPGTKLCLVGQATLEILLLVFVFWHVV